MGYSITKNGKPLNKKLYTICERTKTFSSNEEGLVLDFSGENDWTFNTGACCNFETGWNCTFKTRGGCTFSTETSCNFETGWNCVFNTGNMCTFNTGDNCTFTTAWDCIFTTGQRCTFNTGGDCIFKTGGGCTFSTGGNCVFDIRNNCTVMSCLKETKMLLVRKPTEFRCNNTEFLFKVGDDYVTQDNYGMYKELIG